METLELMNMGATGEKGYHLLTSFAEVPTRGIRQGAWWTRGVQRCSSLANKRTVRSVPSRTEAFLNR